MPAVGNGVRPLMPHPACASCGDRVSSPNVLLCRACKWIPAICDWCDCTFYVLATVVLRRVDDPRYRNSPHYCSRRCPRGPVAFVEQLTTRWQRVWHDSDRFISAAQTAASKRGIRMTTERRDDGRYARGKGK